MAKWNVQPDWPGDSDPDYDTWAVYEVEDGPKNGSHIVARCYNKRWAELVAAGLNKINAE